MQNYPIKKQMISLKKVKSTTQIKLINFQSQKQDIQMTSINKNNRQKNQIQQKKNDNFTKILDDFDIYKEEKGKQKLGAFTLQNIKKLDKNINQLSKERFNKIYLNYQMRGQNQTDQQSSTQQSSLQQMESISLEYQLNIEPSFKRVQFSEKAIQIQPRRQSILQRKKANKNKIKSPSILKNGSKVLNQSIYSETERSFSIQNSFQVRRTVKFGANLSQSNSNKIVKQKYQRILTSLQKQSSNVNQQKNKKIQSYCYEFDDNNNKNECNYSQKFKFKDQLFPPVYSSIFRVVGSKKQQNKSISWMRIPELFKNRKLKVFDNYSETYTQIYICKKYQNYGSDIVLGCFNAIKNNRILLQTLFQKQQNLNPFGIYIIKICIGTSWKYIIVDDFIPVIKNKDKDIYQPAFLNVQLETEQPNMHDPIFVWPFLLEKAYASYYSCYQALKIGSEIDFLSQITDSFYEIIQLNSNSTQSKQQEIQELNDIRITLKQKNVVCLGYSDEDLPYVPLKLQNYHNQTLQDQFLTYYDPLSNFLPFHIKLIQLGTLFSSLYVYRIKEFQYNYTCLVHPPKVLSAKKQKIQSLNKNNKFQIRNNLKLIDNHLESVSIRSFSLLNVTNCNIIVSQRQNRFYMAHKYMWNRVFLFVKEYDGSFRWIFGQYKNTKCIAFKGTLAPGQYYLIIMPEWKENHNRQISILMHSDNQFVIFQRKIYASTDRIIEQGCMDLAQRQGKLIQVNKFICSYNLLYQRCGLIIENICNQRPKGEVTVMRSICGLKSKSQIIPVNSQFYIYIQNQIGNQGNQKLNYNPNDQNMSNNKKLYMKQEIQVEIPSLQNYTVVLKMKGGIDRKFFRAFKF